MDTLKRKRLDSRSRSPVKRNRGGSTAPSEELSKGRFFLATKVFPKAACFVVVNIMGSKRSTVDMSLCNVDAPLVNEDLPQCALIRYEPPAAGKNQEGRWRNCFRTKTQDGKIVKEAFFDFRKANVALDDGTSEQLIFSTVYQKYEADGETKVDEEKYTTCVVPEDSVFGTQAVSERMKWDQSTV